MVGWSDAVLALRKAMARVLGACCAVLDAVVGEGPCGSSSIRTRLFLRMLVVPVAVLVVMVDSLSNSLERSRTAERETKGQTIGDNGK